MPVTDADKGSALDRRIQQRRHIVYYLKVYDLDSGELVGRLVDVTVTGIHVISETPLEPGVELTLVLYLPDEILRRETVIMPSRLLWCRPDVNPDYWGMGFEFLGIGSADATILESLIQEYAFDN